MFIRKCRWYIGMTLSQIILKLISFQVHSAYIDSNANYCNASLETRSFYRKSFFPFDDGQNDNMGLFSLPCFLFQSSSSLESVSLESGSLFTNFWWTKLPRHPQQWWLSYFKWQFSSANFSFSFSFFLSSFSFFLFSP